MTSAANKSESKDSADRFSGNGPAANFPDVDAVESVVDDSSGEDLKETDQI